MFRKKFDLLFAGGSVGKLLKKFAYWVWCLGLSITGLLVSGLFLIGLSDIMYDGSIYWMLAIGYAIVGGVTTVLTTIALYVVGEIVELLTDIRSAVTSDKVTNSTVELPEL